MNKIDVEEVIDCLPKERTLFHYFKDRYALMLLAYVSGEGKSISEIKRSPYGGLLNKPLINALLKRQGNGELSAYDLSSAWPKNTYPFLLTVGVWGGRERWWYQTTRGGHNLVLQLNFSNKHDHIYRRLVRPAEEKRFNSGAHPVMEKGAREYFRETLAWARIDLDLNKGEALIEEIQSDWIRGAASVQKMILRWIKHGATDKRPRGIEGAYEDVLHYVSNVLEPYAKFWDEAMLAATISFIREELGIRDIYYHSFETGWKLKAIGGSKPPRSLYTRLPRKFCFSETDETPVFLASDRVYRRSIKQVANPRWFHLHI